MSGTELIFSSPFSAMQLRCPVRIASPVGACGRLIVRWHTVTAVWDTGAVTSAISRKAADKLQLKVRERTILSTGAGMLPTFKDIILLDLQIDNSVIPVKVAVVDAIPGDDNDFLIGMDIIRCGDFMISSDNSWGVFNVSFKPYPGLFRPIEEIFSTKSTK